MKTTTTLAAAFAAALLAAVPLFSQTVPEQIPSADGIIASGEYRVLKTGSGISVGVTLSEDGSTLYLAVEAQTSGWVALGLGSLRMDGAYMVFGFDQGGKVTVSEQTGKGHGHRPNGERRILICSVREEGGVTTLEFSVPSEGLVRGGILPVLGAYGSKDDLTSMHRRYFRVEIPVAKP